MKDEMLSAQNEMSDQRGFKTTRNLGDQYVKRVNIEPHVSVIQCGEKATSRSGTINI